MKKVESNGFVMPKDFALGAYTAPGAPVQMEARLFLRMCLDHNQLRAVSEISKAIEFLAEIQTKNPGDKLNIDPMIAGWILTGFRSIRFAPGVVLSQEFRECGYLDLLKKCEEATAK